MASEPTTVEWLQSLMEPGVLLAYAMSSKYDCCFGFHPGRHIPKLQRYNRTSRYSYMDTIGIPILQYHYANSANK